MSYLDDPRVYLAAERTLLAWIRTSITTIGLGFVVAKFGLFLRYITPNEAISAHKQSISLLFGLAMVLLGVVSCVGAAVQFQRFRRTLSANEMPLRWSPSFACWIAYAMAVCGLGLAVYLVL
jgi:putative membrane protein